MKLLISGLIISILQLHGLCAEGREVSRNPDIMNQLEVVNAKSVTYVLTHYLSEPQTLPIQLHRLRQLWLKSIMSNQKVYHVEFTVSKKNVPFLVDAEISQVTTSQWDLSILKVRNSEGRPLTKEESKMAGLETGVTMILAGLVLD